MKNFSNYKVSFLSAALGTAVLISSCSAPLEQRSTLDASSADAVKKMEKRLAETVRIRELAKSIEKTLGPVDAVFHDVMKLLDSEKDRLKGELPKFAISELKYALQSLTKEMAIEQKDGSWIVEKNVKWPFERVTEKEKNCENSQVGILVSKMSDDGKAVDAQVYFRDCGSEEKQIVATIERQASGEVSMSFEPSALANLEGFQTEVGNRCLLSILPEKKTYSIACSPFETKVSRINLQFGVTESGYGLYYVKSPEGEAMSFNVAASKEDGTFLAEVLVKQKLGEKVKVSVTRKAL